MKKKLVSSSKRKWVVNGVLAFGAVALLTTGFATWIIGANNTSADGNTDVTVDTAERNNINLTLTVNEPNNSIYVGEQTKEDGAYINIEGGQETDFSINVSIVLEIGKDVEKKPTKLVFDWKKEASEEPEGEAIDVNTINYVTANSATHVNVGGEGGRVNGTKYTYIDLNSEATTLTIPAASGTGWTVTTGENSRYEFTGNLTLFKWGSFFNNEAPSVYYDDLYEEGKITNSSADVDKVYNEIMAMHDALHNETLQLTLTATTAE